MTAPKSTTAKRSTTAPKSVPQKPPLAQKIETTTSAPPNPDAPDLLKKRELIENVVRRSGIKKKDAKPVVEAMLAELGETLASGRGVALPPFGRAKINRQKDLEDGRVLIVKLRQKNTPVQKSALTTAVKKA